MELSDERVAILKLIKESIQPKFANTIKPFEQDILAKDKQQRNILCIYFIILSRLTLK